MSTVVDISVLRVNTGMSRNYFSFVNNHGQKNTDVVPRPILHNVIFHTI